MWMKEQYPQLMLVYVPANCTSVMRIADIVYNRPLKHAFSPHHMASMIESAKTQLDNEVDAQSVSFKDIVGSASTLAPNAFDWLHSAYEALNDVGANSALARVGYTKCWPGAELCISYGMHESSDRFQGRDH